MELVGEENLECSPLDEPDKRFSSFSHQSRGFGDDGFSGGPVKLKLDTPNLNPQVRPKQNTSINVTSFVLRK